MKKKIFGRKFKRDIDERKALFKGLLTSLVIEERIQTTEHKAKAIKARADKLVTKAKKGGTNIADQMRKHLRSDAIDKLLNDIAPRFINRQGGYTRILRTIRRVADNAQMAIMEWTEVRDTSRIVQFPKISKSSKLKIKNKKEDVVDAVIVVEEKVKVKNKTLKKENNIKSSSVKKGDNK